MNKLRVFYAVALAALLTQGCQNISTSLSFDKRILVKVPYDGDPVEVASTNGWRFKPLVVSITNNQQNVPAVWYMAWRPADRNDYLSRKNSRQAWTEVRRLTPALADTVHDLFGKYPMVVQPNSIFGGRKASKPSPNCTATNSTPATNAVLVALRDPPMKVWPIPANSRCEIDPLWYQDDKYTQLRSARLYVESNCPTLNGAIRIGILDCGFDASHAAMPQFMEDDPAANAMDVIDFPNLTNTVPPGATGTPHGTGTIGILAGRRIHFASKPGGKVRLTDTDDYLGADPYATVIPVRVSPWVASLGTAEMAYGIDYASRVKHCDVISMSNGGAPTLIWADAVNSAYRRGTAVFAACGDFYDVFGTDLGFIVPSSTVFPAAFRSVMGVTGVTADGKSYAKNSLWHLLLHPMGLSDWLSRGSYGADMQRRWIFGPLGEPDTAQTWDNGVLHPYPIAAYSPNIPWPVSSTDNSAGKTNLIDLDGWGTSAATPQVAGAAALWLQQNYNEITSSNDWHNWRKAEAVYVALLASASRAKTNQPDHYLGAGILKAHDALQLHYADIFAMEDTRKDRSANEKNHHVPTLGFSEAPHDFFDGERSTAELFLPWLSQPAYSNRVDLCQSASDFSTRTSALKNIYFNGFLLQDFEKGYTPGSKREQHHLEKRAEKLARKLGGTGIPE